MHKPVHPEVSEEGRRLLQLEEQQQDEPQKRLDELIRKRALLTHEIDKKPQLEEKIRLLTKEFQALQDEQAKEEDPTVVGRLKDLGMREQLARYQRELHELESNLPSLHAELEEIESEYKEAFKGRKVPRPILANANKNVSMVNSGQVYTGPETKLDVRSQRIELALQRREVRIPGKPIHFISLADYDQLVEFIESPKIYTLDVFDIKQLKQTLENAIFWITEAIPERRASEALLSTELASSERDLESWKRKAAEAEQEGNPDLAKQAQVMQSECEALSLKYDVMLTQYRNQTAELRAFKSKFAHLIEALVVRVSVLELDPLDFDPNK